MELRDLRYFIAVAEDLHFGRAAARLRISQPPLSQQIRRLEDELGAKLLHRTTRHVQLTPAGQIFLKEARLTVAQAERAGVAARRASQGETGRLVLGFVPAADLKILPTIIPAFRERSPAVQLVLHSMSGAAQPQALVERRIDAGFLFQPVYEKDIVCETVLRESFVVALPTAHRLAALPQLPLRALADEPFILFRRELAPAYFDQVVGFCQKAKFSASITQESDHIQTNLGLVAAGLGVSLLPSSVMSVQRRGVVYRPLAPPVPHLEMGIIYRRDDKTEPLQTLLSVVRNATKENFRGRGRPSPTRRKQ